MSVVTNLSCFDLRTGMTAQGLVFSLQSLAEYFGLRLRVGIGFTRGPYNLKVPSISLNGPEEGSAVYETS
jgi:hypothetical protein